MLNKWDGLNGKQSQKPHMGLCGTDLPSSCTCPLDFLTKTSTTLKLTHLDCDIVISLLSLVTGVYHLRTLTADTCQRHCSLLIVFMKEIKLFHLLFRSSSVRRFWIPNISTGYKYQTGRLNSSTESDFTIKKISLNDTMSIRSFVTMVEAKMPDECVEDGTTVEREMICQDPSHAVLHYQPGEDRFQFRLNYKNGKTLNFNRSANEPLTDFKDRMLANLMKKVKHMSEETKISILVQGETEERESLGSVLDDLVTGSKKLEVHIDEDVYPAHMNPPEITNIKFLKPVMAGFPVFPIKIESTANVKHEFGQYSWDFCPILPNPKGFKKKKKDQADDANAIDPNTWNDCNCTEFVFTPPQEMRGGYLQFHYRPSDGHTIGLPYLAQVAVSKTLPLPETKFLYQIRAESLKKKEPETIRIVTYNTLADLCATAEWFDGSPKDCLPIDYRLPILNQELSSYKADIICMQEVDKKYFEGSFLPFMRSTEMDGVLSIKTGDQKEGCAMFFNTNKFNLLSTETLSVAEQIQTLPMWTTLSSYQQLSESVLQRSTILQLSVLQEKSSNTLLLIGNTHLYFLPTADHIRLLQTITCIESIKSKLVELRKSFPTSTVTFVFCGDFNCTPPFSSIRLLTTGAVLEDDEDWTSHDTQKINPGIRYEHDLKLSTAHPEEELTNITNAFEGCLDYILFQDQHLQLRSSYPPPNKEVIAETSNVPLEKLSLPNFSVPTDHLPLIADFTFKS